MGGLCGRDFARSHGRCQGKSDGGIGKIEVAAFQVEGQRALVSDFSASFQICRAVFAANWQFHSLTFCGDSVSAKDAGQLMVAGGCKSAFHCY